MACKTVQFDLTLFHITYFIEFIPNFQNRVHHQDNIFKKLDFIIQNKYIKILCPQENIIWGDIPYLNCSK